MRICLDRGRNRWRAKACNGDNSNALVLGSAPILNDRRARKRIAFRHQPITTILRPRRVGPAQAASGVVGGPGFRHYRCPTYSEGESQMKVLVMVVLAALVLGSRAYKETAHLQRR
jgi:hypothetical protein